MLARSCPSSSSQRCWLRSRSGLCADQSSSLTPDWEKHFFVELALCSEGLCHVEAGKGQTQTVDTKFEEQFKISLCVVALRFPLIWMEGNPRPEVHKEVADLWWCSSFWTSSSSVLHFGTVLPMFVVSDELPHSSSVIGEVVSTTFGCHMICS